MSATSWRRAAELVAHDGAEAQHHVALVGAGLLRAVADLERDGVRRRRRRQQRRDRRQAARAGRASKRHGRHLHVAGDVVGERQEERGARLVGGELDAVGALQRGDDGAGGHVALVGGGARQRR